MVSKCSRITMCNYICLQKFTFLVTGNKGKLKKQVSGSRRLFMIRTSSKARKAMEAMEAAMEDDDEEDDDDEEAGNDGKDDTDDQDGEYCV